MYISEFNNVPINFIEENSSDGEKCVCGGVKIKMCYYVYNLEKRYKKISFLRPYSVLLQ